VRVILSLYLECRFDELSHCPQALIEVTGMLLYDPKHFPIIDLPVKIGQQITKLRRR